MDDKVSSTNAILLMIIIAPHHAPKGGASVVVGACFCACHGVSDEAPCLNLRISKPCCAKEILAPMLCSHRRSGRELHIQRAPTSRLCPLTWRSAAALPNPQVV